MVPGHSSRVPRCATRRPRRAARPARVGSSDAGQLALGAGLLGAPAHPHGVGRTRGRHGRECCTEYLTGATGRRRARHRGDNARWLRRRRRRHAHGDRCRRHWCEAPQDGALRCCLHHHVVGMGVCPAKCQGGGRGRASGSRGRGAQGNERCQRCHVHDEKVKSLLGCCWLVGTSTG